MLLFLHVAFYRNHLYIYTYHLSILFFFSTLVFSFLSNLRCVIALVLTGKGIPVPNISEYGHKADTSSPQSLYPLFAYLSYDFSG